MIGSGWICYAEKTHGDFILPYISTTRSPQQMMGSLVKGYFASQKVLNNKRLFREGETAHDALCQTQSLTLKTFSEVFLDLIWISKATL